MTMTRIALMLGAVLLLAACGTTDPVTLPTLAPTVPPDNGVAPTQETIEDPGNGDNTDDDITLGEGGDGLFSATLTGALEQTLAGSGDFSCEGDQHVLGVTMGVDVLTFTMPADTATGEYTVEGGASTISSYLEVGGTAYTDDVFGVITFDAVPSAAGEPVSGSFDMNYIAGGDTINAVGNFDLLASNVCG